MSRKLRVGVVGLGIGFQHLSAFRKLPDLYEIVAVCDPVPGRAERMARRNYPRTSDPDLRRNLDLLRKYRSTLSGCIEQFR